jgi:Ca2+-binding EF-hand superfamily protein
MRILFLLLFASAVLAQGRDMWERMARFDKNNDGKITREEFGGADQMFDRLDSDHDGSVTKKEIEARRGRRGRRSGDDSTESIRKKSDTDKDGRVSEKEWKAIFKMADENGDGHLDDSELRAALSGRAYIDAAPKLGAAAPTIKVTRAADGKLVTLTIAKKPLVLVFGSWT